MDTFICFVETETSTVPHLEFLPANSLDDAKIQARRLLNSHRKAYVAHIFQDDELLDTLVPGDEA